ncbi:MAG: NAD-binding protein [Methanofollis sp.]|uniref:potassium channel family protein n=1 Tax=Methanofollis sp. TaxID=2052835 RepID=UPI00261A286A|nr:NAD-binding protein [Methanofollis sp.]MDD4254916.1 NAD-binding protein [Methanofollis sp.]
MRRPGTLWRQVTAMPRARIILYLGLLASYLIVFTLIVRYVFPLWEGRALSWEEAALFVVETITTVGYGDLLPFQSGYTILLAILMIASGVFLIFMLIPLLLAPAISEHLRADPPGVLPSPLKSHVIIVGPGEMIRSLIESLTIADLPIVIVEEQKERAKHFQEIFGKEAWVVRGDYTAASTWRNACIEDADTVVICEREGVAASIILGIRGMTRARIVAVVDNPAYDRYLRYAGAEYVLSPKNTAGKILGRHAAAWRPGETILGSSGEGGEGAAGLTLVSIPITAGSHAAGRTLAELALPEKYNASALFFWKGGRFITFPGGSDRLDVATMLVLLGTAEEVRQASEEVFAGEGDSGEFVIIAGLGDVGKAAGRELAAAGTPTIVIDRKDPAADVVGKAEDEEVLKKAHIEDATTCIVALNNDDTNIFTTLMARNLNPGIRILARANEPASVDKLYLAGADFVTLLPTIGGQAIAGVILSESVRILLDLPDGQKVVMRRAMKWTQISVGRVEGRCGVRVAGIEGGGRAVVAPGAAEVVNQGDVVIAVGDAQALRRFIRTV